MKFMRQKPGELGACLVAGLSAVVLSIGFASCGGDGDSTNATSSKASTSSSVGSTPPTTSGSNSGSSASSGSSTASGSGTDQGLNAEPGQKTTAASPNGLDENTTPQEEREEASKFVPKKHTSTGGGAAQFRVKEGDNSIQEYGEEVTDAEFEEAATVLHNYFDAMAAGNWAAACASFSESMVKSLETLGERMTNEPSGCAGVLGTMEDPLLDAPIQAEADSIDAISLRAEDDTGFLIYRGLEENVYVILMKKDDGHWKVGALAGTSPF